MDNLLTSTVLPLSATASETITNDVSQSAPLKIFSVTVAMNNDSVLSDLETDDEIDDEIDSEYGDDEFFFKYEFYDNAELDDLNDDEIMCFSIVCKKRGKPLKKVRLL